MAPALAAAFPNDTTLLPFYPPPLPASATVVPRVDRLRTLGFATIEVVRNGRLIGRLFVTDTVTDTPH